MSNTDSKTVAVISHLTLIGWVISVILNSNKKSEYGSFYIRQTLVLNLVLSLGFTSFIGRILALVALVFILLSLFHALSGSKTELPLVGNKFQDWFKGL